MRGIELPINVLVVVAIAVIVLLGLVVVYFIGFNPFSGSISLTSLKSTGCSNFSMNYDCGSRGATTASICLPKNTYMSASTTGTICPGNTLKQLCNDYLDADTETECRQICGCI